MISKEEAVQKLKKMGMNVVTDHSMITILLPSDVSFQTGLKDVKSQLKKIEYEASFCVKYGKVEDELLENEEEKLDHQKEEQLIKADSDDANGEEDFDEEDSQEMLDELDHIDDLLSLDDDGQFTLGHFGID